MRDKSPTEKLRGSLRLVHTFQSGHPGVLQLGVVGNLAASGSENNDDAAARRTPSRKETAFPFDGKAVTDWGFWCGVYCSSMAKR